MRRVQVGDKIRKMKVLDIATLSNGWQVVKTEGTKSAEDFMVKIISPQHPIGFTIKHAHFAIDFYGKICRDKEKGLKVLKAIEEIWHGKNINEVMDKYEPKTCDLTGYSLEYILYALNWILEQENINFPGRNASKQKELDEKLEKLGIKTPCGREGGQLAIALFCDIASGVHPVEAFYSAGLSI